MERESERNIHYEQSIVPELFIFTLVMLLNHHNHLKEMEKSPVSDLHLKISSLQN